MAMLKKEGYIRRIAETLSEIHRKDTLDNSTLKMLQKQLAETQKASANMIRAIEMGIITEQTKTRLCELEKNQPVGF